MKRRPGQRACHENDQNSHSSIGPRCGTGPLTGISDITEGVRPLAPLSLWRSLEPLSPAYDRAHSLAARSTWGS